MQLLLLLLLPAILIVVAPPAGIAQSFELEPYVGLSNGGGVHVDMEVPVPSALGFATRYYRAEHGTMLVAAPAWRGNSPLKIRYIG